MKKVVLGLMLVSALCACESLSQYAGVSADDSVKARMRSCLINEATAKYQAGTLFTQGITDTSKELAGTCIKKLALQSAGISEESQTMATSIIQNLQNFGSAQ
jgi:hypothetical protein